MSGRWALDDTGGMRRTIDYLAPHGPPIVDSEGDELGHMSWVVAVSDDYEDEAVRVVLTVEEVGRAGYGLAAHLSPDDARRLRTALRHALREVGEAPGD
jgi:hypothetical protein